MTQEDVALALEISVTTIRRIEQGASPARKVYLLAMECLITRKHRLLMSG